MVDLPNHAAALDVEESRGGDDAVVAVHTPHSVRSGNIRNATLAVAMVLAVATAAWAVWSGDSLPLIAMLLYCMVASTLALYAATAPPTAQPTSSPVAGDPIAVGTSEAWKLVETLTVSDASRLWCSIEPGAAATQESIAWGRALLDAIVREELPIALKLGAPKDAVDWERKNPHYQTQLTRASLKSWANEHGHFPAFLQD